MSEVSKKHRHLLRKAARLWGLQTGYTNVDHELIPASDEALTLLLEDLGEAPANTEADLEGLIGRARDRQLCQVFEPVSIVWAGQGKSDASHIVATVPEDWLAREISYEIQLEDGSVNKLAGENLFRLRSFKFMGSTFVRVHLPLPKDLPLGYHQLRLMDRPEDSCWLFVAPLRPRENRSNVKTWGLFAPLYGLRDEADWGIGDLRAMEKAQDQIHEWGGGFFGTLPMLSSSSEGADYDPSPYSPVSRLFWNEIFLDVESLAKDSAHAQKVIQAPEFQNELQHLRDKSFVDYPSVYQKKKQVLQILAVEFFEKELPSDYGSFLKANPEVERYAKFRADGEGSVKKYHLYVQFQMDRQLSKVKARAKQNQTAGLYLDFPVGVSRGGFDSQQFADSFLLSATVGAPPDTLFPGGQSWGFAPLHPRKIREQGYKYFIQAIRAQMKYASVLRLDHIMGLHRIYVVPEGSSNGGAYLRFHYEEFYALLNIEADRAGVRIVGEDLGTVPDEVREALEEHDLLRMWVLPFEAGTTPQKAIRQSPHSCLSCINTHDMVPFEGYIHERDLEQFVELKVLTEAQAKKQATDRKATLAKWLIDFKTKDIESLFENLLKAMAKSSNELLLINSEDLWRETEPQNIPGTWKEYPNWRRKLSRNLQDWTKDPKVSGLMTEITQLRKENKSDNITNESQPECRSPESRSKDGSQTGKRKDGEPHV